MKKYEESAPIFLEAYGWFCSEAVKYVPKPADAQYPYWVFKDLFNVEQSSDSCLLTMRVPIEEVIFFDMFDWYKILTLRYIGENEAEEKQFGQFLAEYGVRQPSDVFLTNFYPDLKRKVQESWKRLFQHHESIKSGDYSRVRSVQAALWQLKRDWLV